MRKTLDITWHELRLIFLNRSIWLNLVVLPIVISLAVGIAFSTPVNTGSGGAILRVDVINNDTGPQGAAILERMRAINTNLLFCPVDNREDDPCELDGAGLTPDVIQDRLIEQTSLALIVIPEAFSARLDAGQASSLIYRSNDNAVAPNYILQALQAAAQEIGGAQTAANAGLQVADRIEYLTFSDEADRVAFAGQIRNFATTAWEMPPARVAYFTSQSEGQEIPGGGFNQSIPGIASMYVMFIIFPAAAVLIRDRKQGTFQRVLVMPVRRSELLGGKMSARFVIGMTEYAIIFAFGALLGVRYGGAPVALVVLMASFVLCITALTLLMTTFLKTEQQAQGIALFLTLTLAPLGGAWWPLAIVPEWMRIIGHISPVAWVMDGFHALFYTGAGFEAVILPVVVLLGMTALFFGFGVRRFKFE